MSKVAILSFLVSFLAFSNATEKISPQIVGGRNATIGQFPYMASFQIRGNRGTHLCGGGILNDRWILTAAHCLVGEDLLPRVIAVVGTVDLEIGGAEHDIEKTVSHPLYVRNVRPFWMSNWNDIGFYKTKTRIAYNQFVQPIPLHLQRISGRVPATVAGFGNFMPNISLDTDPADWVMSRQLRFMDTTTLSHTECSMRAMLHQASNPLLFWNPIINPMTCLCTLQEREKGICFGDSGSMLIHNGQVIGVVVSSVEICARGVPDIFVRVSSYIDWINSYIHEV